MKTRLPLAVGVLLTALSLAACSAPAAPAERTPTTSTSPSPTTPRTEVQPAPADKPTPVSSQGKPTCETIVSQGTVDALKSQGWTFQEREFRIGDVPADSVPVEGGLKCLWSDYSTASDHGQMYAWGPITADKARAAQTALQADGWLMSSEDGSIYLTEDPAYAIGKDDDGFGMTYEFGDGWVKFSDTKQGLLLIDWAQ